MIRENRVVKNIDREDRSERFESSSNPFTSVGVINARDIVVSGQESSADASLDAVHYSYLIVPKLFGTFGSDHVLSPLEFGIWEHYTEQKRAVNGQWMAPYGGSNIGWH